MEDTKMTFKDAMLGLFADNPPDTVLIKTKYDKTPRSLPFDAAMTYYGDACFISADTTGQMQDDIIYYLDARNIYEVTVMKTGTVCVAAATQTAAMEIAYKALEKDVLWDSDFAVTDAELIENIRQEDDFI